MARSVYTVRINSTAILKCVVDNQRASIDQITKTTSCHSAAARHLAANSDVWVENGNEGFFRPMETLPQSTFWGVYRLNGDRFDGGRVHRQPHANQ